MDDRKMTDRMTDGEMADNRMPAERMTADEVPADRILEGGMTDNSMRNQGIEAGKREADSMVERIRRSARDIKVPEGLQPEAIQKKLEASQAAGSQTSQNAEPGASQGAGTSQNAEPETGKRGFPSAKKWRRYLPYAYGICGAAVLLLCCSVLLRQGLFSRQNSSQGSGQDAEGRMMAGGEPVALSAEEALTEMEADNEAPAPVPKAPKQDAGDLYTVASSYEEVYDLVMSSRVSPAENWWDFLWDPFTKGADMAVVEEAGTAAVGAEVPMESPSDGAMANSADLGAASYSTTNLQVEGVDESDIVKTDGSYLYTVSGNQVYITDIRARQMKPAGEILFPGAKNGSGQIRELYVSGNRLFLIASEYGSSLQQEGQEDEVRVYSFDSTLETVLYTYDIENPQQPGLLGSFRQEGDYMTSRKVDDVIYLFTRYSLWDPCSNSERTQEDWLPSVGTGKVAADHIYVPKQGGNALVVSSVNQNSPDQAADHVMLVNDSAEVYVTSQSIYLYSRAYEGGIHTQVARFSLQDGSIDGVGAASVNGYVRDTFAVNESGDTFRILTTDDNGETQNCLSLFDLNLKPISSLSGIAKGEMIYAARYLGDMVYFVTYRNMDPLFAVDLSDAEHPRILGELEITGYSEYLHNWGNGQLLGIGYETDPDTGESKGIKLSMFDISDPATLKVKDCVILKNADWSPAMDSYKAVLADPREGLVGFLVTEYGQEIKQYYVLFDWQDASFHSLLTFSLEQGVYENNVRGLYAGNYFYIVSDGEVSCFDRLEDYRLIGQLKFGD